MIKIAKITQTCFACPSQWEGIGENGEDIYIRFRHGFLRLDVNGTTKAEYDHPEKDGIIDFEEVLEIFKDHICVDESSEQKHMGMYFYDEEPNF